MDYTLYQVNKEKEFEANCQRCGNCCGAKTDPCVHLIKQTDESYLCDIYASRGGIQKTHAGKFFQCVPVRDILHDDWPGSWDCAYRKNKVDLSKIND